MSCCFACFSWSRCLRRFCSGDPIRMLSALWRRFWKPTASTGARCGAAPPPWATRSARPAAVRPRRPRPSLPWPPCPSPTSTLERDLARSQWKRKLPCRRLPHHVLTTQSPVYNSDSLFVQSKVKHPTFLWKPLPPWTLSHAIIIWRVTWPLNKCGEGAGELGLKHKLQMILALAEGGQADHLGLPLYEGSSPQEVGLGCQVISLGP